ncbi:MAG: HEAT repeat domain-containing protein [Pseudanabaena sp. SU_2_4]|nr:HEAT repeat domain-containing protein [Pseudanabaena sp. SU_2_4]
MKPEIQYLSARLDNPDEEVREEAALELSRIGTEDVADPLLNHLGDPVLEVRQMVIYGLGKTKAERVIPSLVNCLKDPSLEVRWVTVEALGEIGSPKAIAPLVACLEKEPVWNVRASTAKALGKIGSQEALAALVKCLRYDEDSFVRQEALDALDRLVNLESEIKLEEILTHKLVERIARTLPDIDWFGPIAQFKQIYETASNAYERLTQSRQLLYELAGLHSEAAPMRIAECGPMRTELSACLGQKVKI